MGGGRERRGQKIGEYGGGGHKWRGEREGGKGGREGRVKRMGGGEVKARDGVRR